MPMNKADCIEEIIARVTAVQKDYIGLQEQLQQAENNLDALRNDSTLRLIDVLDLIGTMDSNKHLNQEKESQSIASLIIKKIEKRLLEILKQWDVQEISLNEGRIESGKVRVLQARLIEDSTAAEGDILEVCRKGYQRGNKIIRPADVITARGVEHH